MHDLVLVTGASRGIGAAIAKKFMSHGRNVIGLSREARALEWPMIACDVGDIAALEKTFEQVCRQYGRPTVLVNNAGAYFAAAAIEETVEQFDATMNVNVRSVFRLSQLFAAALEAEQRDGVIVNVSSVSGRIGSVDPAYAASKAAVDALTKSFARVLAPRGIRVNAVAPGPVDTEMGDRIPEDRKQQYKKTILLQRFGKPEEVANLVYFLASEEASLVTGEIIYATGGIL